MSKISLDLLKSYSDKLERITESAKALASAWAEVASEAKRFAAMYAKQKRGER